MVEDESKLIPKSLEALDNGNMDHFIESKPPGVKVHDLTLLIDSLTEIIDNPKVL